MLRLRALSAALPLVLVAAACGSSGDDAAPTTSATAASTTAATTAPPTTPPPTTVAPTTTAAPATTTRAPAPGGPRAYAELGPYPVGVVELDLGEGRPVTVWYPAEPGVEVVEDQATYDMRGYLPPAEAAKVPEAATFTMDAYDGLPPATDGPFPLVLFSHGYAGYRTQSSFLTTALASWGYVVASPQHVSRDLASVLAAPPEGAPSDVDDLRATRDLLTTEAARAGGPLEGAVDTAKVALVGHSAGGFAIRQLVSDPGVVAMVPLASPAGLGQDGQPQQPVPTVPSLYVAGSADVIAALPRVTQAYEQAAGPPKRFAVLDGVTHLGFMDVCTIAQDQGGVLQAATDAGVNVNPVVLRLFADGCDPQYTDATDAWPAIRHLVVAQVRTAMGADATPVGLDASVGTAYPPMAITYTDQLS